MNSDMTLTPETILSRNPEKFLTSRIGEELIMMNVQNGDYLGINRVGADVWEKLAEPRPLSKLIAEMKAEYDVDPVECEQQCYGFVRQMLAEGMICVKENPSE